VVEATIRDGASRYYQYGVIVYFWNDIVAQIMEIVGEDQNEPRLTTQGTDDSPQFELKH